MILSIALQVSISPLPKSVKLSGTFSALADPYYVCTYEDSGNECADHVKDNFDFFKQLMFVRDLPYSQSEYYLKQIEPAVSSITVLIKSSKEDYDIETLDESYTLKVTMTEILITASNNFGAARAFASLIQLADKLDQLPEDEKAYSIAIGEIADEASFKWRQLLIDASRHYLPMQSIYRAIDSLSITKMNVLHFHLIDANSFPLHFREAPIRKLFKGAYSPEYYYSMKDLTELAQYAFKRGVFLFVEFEVPGHVESWIKGMPEIMANCPSHDTLDPTNPKTYETIKAALKEIFAAVYENQAFKIKPLIHLGGDEVNTGCWNNDPAIKKYMNDKQLTPKTLWHEFHSKLNEAVKEAVGENIHQVFWEEAWNNGNVFSNNSIVHLWLYTNKNPICEKGFKVIESTRFYLPRSKPTGAGHYAWQDTWQDFYQADIMKDADKCKPGQVLGGGAALWGERAWAALNSQEQLIWPRTIGVAETLWSGNWLSNRNIDSAVTQRVNHLSCKLKQAGIKSGPVDSSAPCFGEVL